MSGYPEWAYLRNDDGKLTRNWGGQPIVAPEHFMEPHVVTVPGSAGTPPFCSCGWTRWYDRERGLWVEMADHRRDCEPVS